MKKIECLFFCFLLTLGISAQVTIYSENFTGYTNCTTVGANNNVANPAPDWTSVWQDCDDAVSCSPSQSYWGTYNGEFRVNDIEGGPCTCGSGGTTSNFITTETIDISAYSNVSMSVSTRYTGSLETGSIGACDNSGDIVEISYSLDGGPFTQFATNGLLNGGFSPNPAVSSQGCINGSTLVLRIRAGNKANDENFYFDNILVQGFAGPFVASAGADDTICPGGSVVLNGSGGGTYTWNASPDLSCTNCQNPVADPMTTTSFILTVDQGGCSDKDTVTIYVQSMPINIDLGNDTMLCTGSTLLLDATQPAATYLWQDASTDSVFTVNGPGTYHVTVNNLCGSGADTIVISPAPNPAIDLGNDTLICGSFAIVLDASVPFASYLWQDNSTDSTLAVSGPGTYFVNVTNICGAVKDTVVIQQAYAPVVNLGNDRIVCPGPIAILFDATNPSSSYLWQDNSTDSVFNATNTGLYYVTVSNVCGSSSDSVLVQQAATQTLDLGPDQVLCSSSFISLDATLPGATGYQWQDASNTATYNATLPGTYYVEVTTQCSTLTDTIHILPAAQINDMLDDIFGDCGEDTVSVWLNNLPAGATLVWSNGDTTTYTQYATSGNHYVNIYYCSQVYTDNFGVFINASSKDELFMPNVFTPNGDGINDTYHVGGIFDNTVSFSAVIFNRWGEEIYRSVVHDFEWDGTFNGTPVSQGTYYLVIEMRKTCTVEEDVKEATYITLFR